MSEVVKVKNTSGAFIIGFAAGDALGVPVEFATRQQLQKEPIREMIGYGNHCQRVGTWSDDTSLTIATIDSLADGYNPNDIAARFVRWLEDGEYTANGSTFDVGFTTRFAIKRAKNSTEATKCGGDSQSDNGNGSLMRIMPLAFYLKNDTDFEHRKTIIYDVSSITHAHIISKIACHFLTEFAIALLSGFAVDIAYEETRKTFTDYYKDTAEAECFTRIFSGELLNATINNVKSSGYVVDTLESAIWCIFHTDSYQSAVLTAVNMGGDTDTIGAITGGIAGIIYGYDAIPTKWEKDLENKELLYQAASRLEKIGHIKENSMTEWFLRKWWIRKWLKNSWFGDNI